MHGERGDPWLVREEDGAAVALMDVAIDDQHAFKLLGVEEPFGRQGEVIQDAKALGAVGVRVVGAACDVHGYGA